MRRLLLGSVATVLFSIGAQAADIVVSKTNNPDTAVIGVSGRFEFDDIQKFNEAIAPYSNGVVVFASIGGNLEAGLKIGEAIHAKDFGAYVPGGMMCASACALAWLGGSPRLMAPGAKIGFHAAYRYDSKGGMTPTGSGNALVGAYLNRLGLQDAAVAYVTEAAPDQITWLTARKAALLGIDVKVFDIDDQLPSQQPAIAQPATPLPPDRPVAAQQPYRQQVPPEAPQFEKRIGPSYDCAKSTTQIMAFICSDNQIAKADLAFVQPYYILRYVGGPSSYQALKVEAVNFQNYMAMSCGITPTGMIPDDRQTLKSCMLTKYAEQYVNWLRRLSGPALEEASRSVKDNIALQQKLQDLGFIPPTDNVDGIFGTGTRSAIQNWQASSGRQQTGLLGDADAALLLRQQAVQQAPPVAPKQTKIQLEFLQGVITYGNAKYLSSIACRNFDHIVHINISIDWLSDKMSVEQVGSRRLIVWDDNAEYLFPKNSYNYLHGEYVVNGYFIVRHGGTHQGIVSLSFERINDSDVLLNPNVVEIPTKGLGCN